DPDVAEFCKRYKGELAHSRLADPGMVFALAIQAVRESRGAPLLKLPVLFLDVRVRTIIERDFAAVLVQQAPSFLATIPAGDERTGRHLGEITGVAVQDLAPKDVATSLSRLQFGLFDDVPSEKQQLDDTLSIFSAPGETRECVEIARGI